MSEFQDIIDTIIAEASAEGPEGMRWVGETILNRAAIRGIDPTAVVRQPNQYTGYFAPGPAAVAAQRDPKVRTAVEAAWELARQSGDPTGGADHYHAYHVDPDWAGRLTRTGQQGQHLFYRSQPVPADALAAWLTPQNRDVARPRPRPQSPTDQANRLFAGTAANAGAARQPELANSLGDFIARQNASTMLTRPQQIDRTVNAAQAGQNPLLAQVLAAHVQLKQQPRMTTAQLRADNR